MKNFIKITDIDPAFGKIIIPKEEPKYPIGGYAPGNYYCTCSTCKTQFQGDKRAVQCEPCAIKMTKEELKTGYSKSETKFIGVEFTLADGSKQFVPANLKEESKQDLEEVECNMCGDIMSLLEDESNYVCFNNECTRCYEEYGEEPKQEETLEEVVYQKIGLAANEQGIINQAQATSNVMKVLEEKMYSEVFEWLSSKDYLSDEVGSIQKEFEQFKKK